MFGCAVFVVLAVCLCGADARAQDAPAPAAAAEAEPELVNRGIPRQNLFAQKYHFTLYEMEQYSERLDLSAEQHEIFAALFSAMQERVMEAERPLREAEAEWEAFSNEVFRDEDSGWRDTPERFASGIERLTEMGERADELEVEWVALQERLGAEMFADLRLLLTPEQIERLDDVHRWRHRARLMRWSELPYASQYVPGIARSMELRPDPARFGADEAGVLEVIYDEYDRELDELLLERVAIEKEHLGIARGFGGDPDLKSLGSTDPAELAWLEAVGEQNLKIADMQKKYIRRIASLLTPEDGAAFQERCYEKAYWHVLLDSAMDERFENLLEHPALTEEQRARVEAVRDEYRRERSPIEDQWISAIDDYLADGGARIAGAEVPVAVGDPMGAEPGADKLFGFVKQRLDLKRAYTERLEDLRAEFGLDDDAEQPAG